MMGLGTSILLGDGSKPEVATELRFRPLLQLPDGERFPATAPNPKIAE
jgi:hypothetical protein